MWPRGGQSGYYFDPETNLYLLGGGGRGRYYDPQLARFQNADPIGLASGDANLYRYVANDPVNRRDPSGNQDDGSHASGQVNSANNGVTISDVLAAYHLAYPSDSLFAQAAEAAVQITEGENWYWNWNYFPNGGTYEDNNGKTETVDLIRFDRDYLKRVDLHEAVENLRTALIKLRDDPGSKMARVATRWDGNVEDFLKSVTGNLKVLAAGTRPYELQGSAVEAMNEGIVSTLEFMPYASGLLLIGQLSSGRKLSFTVYGQRDLSTTEKVVIIGGAAGSYIVGVLVSKGGKWVLSKTSDEFSSLSGATKYMDEIAPVSLANSIKYAYPKTPELMAAFRTEMRRIKELFKASGGKLDPDLPKNWDRVVFENGKPVWGKYDPMKNTIKVFRGSDEITLMEELLHFEVQQRYLKGLGWSQSKFVAEASKWSKSQWEKFRIWHEAQVQQRFLELGFTLK